MNFKNWLPSIALLAALLAALSLTGCNATTARISLNNELFNSYSPRVQAIIKANRIAEGFDSNQVSMALGNANRIELQGFRKIWTYYETFEDTIRVEKSADEYRDEMITYENAFGYGYNYVPEPTTHRLVNLYRTRVVRTVRFEDGLVVGWEEPEHLWLSDWHQ